MWARDFLLPTTSPNWRDWVEFNKTVTRNEGVHPSVDPVWLRSNVTPCFKEYQMVANFTVSGLGCVMFHVVALITLPHQCTGPLKTLGISVQFWGSFCISSLQKFFFVHSPGRKGLESTSITLRPPFSKSSLIHHSRVTHCPLYLPWH